MILVKFTENRFKDSVMAGRLHFSPLSHFWENGNEEQKDILEGVSGDLRVDTIKNLLKKNLRNRKKSLHLKRRELFSNRLKKRQRKEP